ncbi:MAG: ABC transporter [Candidatus Poribacteria bacterium]|nr:ABC transporter [Candidatus Poribacteria bacterium]
MNELQFPGARWWKFDFHTHTPASVDFNDKELEPEDWLKAFMEKEIDCVAITDHNIGGWVDCLKQTYKKLQENKPQWFRPIYLFPGVEISANGNVHILAIFGCDKGKSHIDELIGAIDYQGTKGGSDGVTTKSVTEVVDEIAERGGIPIPAHVEKEDTGLFKLKGTTRQQILRNENIYAMELGKSDSQISQFYADEKFKWTEITGSDTHDFSRENFGTFTWIKMANPSIVGLKLALIDGIASVNRDIHSDPNRRVKYFVEELDICMAKHIGRSKPLTCRFSPFLNAIIGGRGTGKSTLLEFMRLVLRRDNEIPVELVKESRQYFGVGGANLLIEDSKISLIYRKGEVRYRLNWSSNPDYPSLEEEKYDGNWSACEGEIKSLFPVRIYSQKQIYELAKKPSALIEIIDEVPVVDAVRLKTENNDLVNRYKQIESKQRELNDKIAEESRLRGELNDLARQIEYIEKSGHKEVMQKYRLRQQQLNEIDILEDKWKEAQRQLLEIREKITPAEFNQELFSDNNDVLLDIKRTNDKWSTIHNELKKLGKTAESIINEWQTEKDAAPWMQEFKSDIERYEKSRSEFEQENINPDKYHLLLTQQKNIKRELDLIGEYQVQKQTLETEKQEVFDKIRENREILTEKRQEFLTSVLHDNQFVSIKVLPFGEEWSDIENEIRSMLQCPDRFDKDIEQLRDIYQPDGDKDFEKLKDAIKDIRNGNTAAKDYRFATHLKGLPQESISVFLTWFPGDNLEVTYGADRHRIQQGSPGQKTAALLAFILSYGDEPLLLDQPEDDLDNELIYDLIVKQLRDTKSKRQVIVVTHNANIVINGDAEMVFPLHIVCTETRIRHAANIQEKKVRDAICNIIEGGEKAFEQRYKRIHLGD